MKLELGRIESIQRNGQAVSDLSPDLSPSPFFGLSRRKQRLLLGGLSLLLLLLYLWHNIFIPIGSGRLGVLWSRFGGEDRPDPHAGPPGGLTV